MNVFKQFVRIYTNLYVFLQVCTYLYMFVRIYTSVYVFIHVCTYLYKFVRIYTSVYVCIQVCTYLYKFVRIYTSLYVFIQGCTYLYKLYVFIQVWNTETKISHSRVLYTKTLLAKDIWFCIRSNLQDSEENVNNHVKMYMTQVLKGKGNRRVNMGKWYNANNQLLVLFAPGVKVDKFAESEKCYYYDQINLTRKMPITNEIDDEYEKECRESRQQEVDLELERDNVELYYAL